MWSCSHDLFPFFSAGLLFFTTYTLLVLFWAEIYHQARSMPTGSLKPAFVGLNVVVYLAQVWGAAGGRGVYVRVCVGEGCMNTV